MFIVPWLVGFSRILEPAVRLVPLIAPSMVLAGIVTAVAALKRKERGFITSVAVAWNAVLLVGFIAYGVMLWTLLSQIRGTATPPQDIFETLIAWPLPETVSHLQGAKGSSFQGYTWRISDFRRHHLPLQV